MRHTDISDISHKCLELEIHEQLLVLSVIVLIMVLQPTQTVYCSWTCPCDVYRSVACTSSATIRALSLADSLTRVREAPRFAQEATLPPQLLTQHLARKQLT